MLVLLLAFIITLVVLSIVGLKNVALVLLTVVILVVTIAQFSKIPPRAKQPGKSIAVIGSGPAGIMMARQLQRRGYKDITMYGRFQDAQVETLNVDGVVVDTQACFFHSGYNNSIMNLCEEYGFETTGIHSSSLSQQKDGGVSHPYSAAPRDGGVMNALKLSVLILYHYHMNPKSSVLGQNAKKFAMDHHIKWQNAAVFLNGQLYGFPEDITVESAMSWYSSYLSHEILGYLTYPLSRPSQPRGTRIIKKGYEPLFRAILDTLTAKKDQRLIRKVEPSNGSVKLTLADNSTAMYDSVVVACPTTQLQSPMNAILKPSDYKVTYVFVLMYLGKVHRKQIGVYYNFEALESPTYNTITATRYFGKNAAGLGIHGALGYVTKGTDLDKLKTNIIKQTTTIVGSPVESVILWKVLQYNTRFSSDAILRGAAQKARDLQGKDNVWYGTAPFCHWNLDGIYEHVMSLSRKV